MPRSAASTKPNGDTTRVRARTRALLVDAAVRVFARKGTGEAAIHEIAAEAGVANGTFYNYFRTREEVLEAAALRLAERLIGKISASYADVADPAERVAIGSRRFILEAVEDPVWASALAGVWSAGSTLRGKMAIPILADLRAGRRRGRFRYRSEAAAADLLEGGVLAGMRSVLERRAGEAHATEVASLVLRGLGVEPAEADEIARRPLPRFPQAR